MIFWIVVALLACGLGVTLARPLLRGASSPAAPRGAYDIQVYRDQLAEIERDRARGVLSDEQAQSARLEVERRLLAASDAAPPAAPKPIGAAPLLAAAITLAVPALALLLYSQLGRPGTPGQPFAQRMDQRGAPTQPQAAGQHPAGGDANESMQALTERLAKRLEADPGDPEGWSLLARSYQQLDRHRDAVAALERAVALTQRDPQLLAALAEARIMAADGTVPPPARAEFEEVLKQQPKDPRARFYIAVAEAQAGKMKEGLDLLVALAKDTPAEAPYLPMLRERVAAMANEMKQDPARLLAGLPRPIEGASPQGAPAQGSAQPPQPSSAPAASARPERGPTAGDVAAAQNMSAGDRQQMIRGMVDGLAARLDGEPGDVEGWLRLIRAYKVLGDDAKASEAAGKASAANPAARPRIVETAQQLGVTVASAAVPAPAAATPPRLDAAAIRAGAAGGDVAGFRRRLDGNPNDREALWQVGLAEATTGNRIGAAELWGRLLGQFDPGSPEYAALRERLDALKRGG